MSAPAPPTVAGDAPYLRLTTAGDPDTGVPEPGTLSLAGLALLGFGLVFRRRKI
jgi:LPXTG-motif cell wall-anchored protein